MTANNMSYELLLLLDSLYEYGAPGYDDTQISTILSKAQLRVFNRKYNPLKNAQGKGFEATEERRRDLDQLVKPAYYLKDEDPVIGTILLSDDQVGVHENGVFFDLPDDFLYAIEESLLVLVDDVNRFVSIRPITHDEYSANKYNPYKYPTTEETSSVFWRMDLGRLSDINSETPTSKRLEIITDGNEITKYNLRYIMTPPNIVVDTINPANQVHCLLSEGTQSEIIDEAYKIAKGSIKPEEYQIALNEQKISEN